MTETRKWIDLYPGKTHEFGTRVRILGHARMNDNAVRLYYEEIVETPSAATDTDLSVIGQTASPASPHVDPEQPKPERRRARS